MKKNNKGFTLMEMLIVVAIIAVLIAIAIPTFTGSLDKARLAADEANVRAAYSEAMSKYLLNDFAQTTDTSITVTTAATMKTTCTNGKVKNEDVVIADIPAASIAWTANSQAKVTVTKPSTTGDDAKPTVTVSAVS